MSLLTSEKIVHALRVIRPNANFSVGETYSSLTWHDGGGVEGENQNKPTEQEFNDAVLAFNNEYDSKQYQRDRKLEYPTIEELVVALYDEEDKQAIIEKRNAVKAKYPKPE